MSARPTVRTQSLPLKQVQLTTGFWKQRQDTNRKVTLPMEHQQCVKTDRIGAFKLDWKPGEVHQPHHFWDSDLAKWIEAAGYSLATHPDPKLEKTVDEVIDLVVSAQHPDGYLNVFYTVVQPGKRWTNLRDMHELYCAGHLIEAAVAYYQGTGKRKLLDCLCRYTDHIAKTFGPGKDQKPGYCGHPEVELAIMKLYHATGEKRYLDLANFFVTERGKQPLFFDVEADARGEDRINQWHQKPEYFQAHEPIVEQKTLEGHAVRALYLLSGTIDVAAETGNSKLWNACKRLFNNATQRRMYITGGVGSARHNERFTEDYDLPNETAYAETCAAIALALTAHRMLQVEPDRQYADIMEKALYNGILSGVSLAGDRFFYANPLEIDYEALHTDSMVISAARQPWFDCACCPPNIARLLAEVNQLIYSTSADTLYVHLYAASKATISLAGQEIGIEQKTHYPWDGNIRLTIQSGGKFTLALRIPGWCESATLGINGKKMPLKLIGGYVHLKRDWSKGDVVELVLAMPVMQIETNPRCRNNANRVAIQRGPVIYCAEEVDNGPYLASYAIPRNAKWKEKFEPRFLGGVTTLTGQVQQNGDANWDGQLYRPVGKTKLLPAKLKLIPYCVWGNRKVGRMQVWLPVA